MHQPAAPAAFYLPGPTGTFESTAATTSPWDASLQHGGPPAALLARAIENCQPRPDLAVVRISIDFLGPIPQGRMSVDAQVLRPGRRVELVEARLSTGGRSIVVARAWRSQVTAASVPSVPAEPAVPSPPPGPQPQQYFPGLDPQWGYGRAIEWRFVRGGFQQLGPVAVWARPLLPLVAGEVATGLQRSLIVADSANGLSAELDLAEWLFIPPTLGLTLYREHRSEWLLLQASTVIDPRGTGMAHATLSDEFGEYAVATQPLLVQRRQ
ncbi:MAG: thioesterase family protein [Jatrophihabitans sp.]